MAHLMDIIIDFIAEMFFAFLFVVLGVVFVLLGVSALGTSIVIAVICFAAALALLGGGIGMGVCAFLYC
jgi:hypothetical protein